MKLKAALQALVEELERGLEASTEDGRPVSPDSSIGRLTRQDALQQQHLAMARRERLEAQRSQVRRALAAIEDGTYGECIRCEEPIGLRRLEARPETPLCLRCQGGSSR
jgi:DnaK suppressor protein